MPRKLDPDKADEGTQPAPAVNATPRVSSNRVKGAYFLGGEWRAADGTLLTAPEAQQAHRAMDKAAAEARAKALLGGAE